MPVIPFIPAILSAVSLVGGSLKNNSASSASPTLDPKLQPLQNLVTSMITQRLNGGSLPPAYEAGGIKGINAGYQGATTSLNADLTRRGLAASPIAGAAVGKMDTARAGDIGTFETNLPIIQRSLQNQDLGLAGSLLGQGRGIASTTSTGGGAAGAFENLAGYLGYLTGKGAFNKPAAGGSTGYPYGGTNYEGAQY